jgi:hypothetical protein
MKGEVAPLHRKALLNALKTAAALDPERLDELLDAAQRSFVALGLDSGADLWTLGPLLEIAGRLARHEDRVQEKLPQMARELAQRQIVSPDRFGLDIEREESLTLSLLASTARIERMVERESFGMTREEARDWILDVALQAASHLYAELEVHDAAASDRPDVGVEGKQMLLQAALRETLNLLEPHWWQQARILEEGRARGSVNELRAWLETQPEEQAISRIVEGVGDGVDALLTNLSTVRSRITAMRERLSRGWKPTEESVATGSAGPEVETQPEPQSAEQLPSAIEPSAPESPAPIYTESVAPRRFGRRR